MNSRNRDTNAIPLKMSHQILSDAVSLKCHAHVCFKLKNKKKDFKCKSGCIRRKLRSQRKKKYKTVANLNVSYVIFFRCHHCHEAIKSKSLKF